MRVLPAAPPDGISRSESSEEGAAGDWRARIHPEDAPEVRRLLAEHREGMSPAFEAEFRVLRKDGQAVWVRARGLAARDSSGRAIRVAGSLHDIGRQKKAEARLEYQAFYDTLTHLPNRALFVDRLGRAVRHAARRKGYQFAVLYLDLDRFKLVNDSLGHGLGDKLLLALSRRFVACLRAGDSVARLGADEFAILLDDIRDTSDAIRVAERIQRALAQAFELEGHEIFATVSIGIALSATGYEKPDEILRDADIAMARAKSEGKNRYAMFDQSSHARALGVLRMEADLRRALDQQGFFLAYQPIVRLAEAKIAGFEALIRWKHPERGFISPMDFIPVAEETGLIVPLGQWVLEEACRQGRAWKECFGEAGDLTMAVNVSSKQFSRSNVAQMVRQTIDKTGFEASRLRLEITESAVMENAQSAGDMLRELKELGLRISLDDFGTGYSSLSTLHQFPVDVLKIDRSFVNAMGKHDSNAAIARTIISLAELLSMTVVAEGIETAEQAAALKALSCEYGQGYFFAKPLEAAAAEALIASPPAWKV